MTAATFGDFLRQADEHLEAAVTSSESQTADQVVTTRALGRLVAGMARCLDDRARYDVVEVVTRPGLRAWDRAAVDASAALRKAADCLDQGARTAEDRESGPGDAARHLAAAATSLAAGRDLLHTHLATTPDDLWAWRSEWAPAVTSPPITRALTAEVARWSYRLAPLTAGLASAGSADSPASAIARNELQVATQWLWAADAAVQPAQAANPVTADDARLLCAIPAAQRPGRLPPSGAESVTELCEGIRVSAERLRTAVFGTAERAQWTPAATADTWRWTARAAAVIGHASELALRSLSEHAGRGGGLSLDRSQLHAAADAVARTWTAWRQVSATWNGLTTETRGHATQITTEMTDLLLRMGRLTWDDPRWRVPTYLTHQNCQTPPIAWGYVRTSGP